MAPMLQHEQWLGWVEGSSDLLILLGISQLLSLVAKPKQYLNTITSFPLPFLLSPANLD